MTYRIIIQEKVSNEKCIFQQHTIPALKLSRVNTSIQKHSTNLSIGDIPKIKDERRRAEVRFLPNLPGALRALQYLINLFSFSLLLYNILSRSTCALRRKPLFCGKPEGRAQATVTGEAERYRRRLNV